MITNNDHNMNCLQQPGPAYMVQPMAQASPPDYQGLAWFACLCCCWPLGIVAILKSNEVSKLGCYLADLHCSATNCT